MKSNPVGGKFGEGHVIDGATHYYCGDTLCEGYHIHDATGQMICKMCDAVLSIDPEEMDYPKGELCQTKPLT